MEMRIKVLLHWKELMLFLFLFLILFVVGSWRLPHSPSTWFDEGINIGISQSLVEKHIYSLRVTPNMFVAERYFLITTNYPVLIPVAISLKLLGYNFVAARLPMLLYLLFFGLVFYLLVRRQYGSMYALFSLSLLVSFAPLYGNGKAVLGEVPGLLFFLLGLSLLPKDYSLKRLLISGLMFGLAIATKPFFLIIIPAVLIGEWYRMVALSASKFFNRLCLLLLGATFPLLIWLYTIIPDFSPIKVIHAVSYYSNSYAANNFLNIIFNNLFRFFSETTPIHFFLMFVVVVCGAVYRLKKKEKLSTVEVILFIFIILNWLWYLKTPGWYRYFFTAHILLFLMFPYYLRRLLNKKAVIILLSILFLVQFTYLLFKRTDILYNSDSVAVVASYITQNIERQDSLLVINNPSLAFLLDRFEPYQYLQINPSLHFGLGSLNDNSGQPFSHIIISGDLNESRLNNLVDTLNERYTKEYQYEKYIIYHYEQ